MAKLALEKQIERQMKQDKRMADRQHREEQRKMREQQRLARKEAIRQQAASIVNGQAPIEGFRIMDATAEKVLECLLRCELQTGNRVTFNQDILPDYVQLSIELEMEKLTQYGLIAGVQFSICGDVALNLLPPAFTYVQEKEKALELQKKNQQEKRTPGIINYHYGDNYGNQIWGNVSDSTLLIDNSIHEIERTIDECGGEDKEELHKLLDEIKELVENMETSRSIPKQKRLYQKISDHMEKHGWFYGAVVQLLGTAAMNMLGAG